KLTQSLSKQIAGFRIASAVGVGRCGMAVPAGSLNYVRPAATVFELEALEGLPCGCVAAAYRARPWDVSVVSLQAKCPHCMLSGPERQARRAFWPGRRPVRFSGSAIRRSPTKTKTTRTSNAPLTRRVLFAPRSGSLFGFLPRLTHQDYRPFGLAIRIRNPCDP